MVLIRSTAVNSLLAPTAPTLRRLAGLTIVAGALLVGACGDGEPTASDGAASGDAGGSSSATVEIERSRFEPKEVTITAGGTVEFVNNDPFAHTVTSADGSDLAYDSGSFGEDETFSQTYDAAGSYAYFCEIHPTMRATVVVE